MPLSTVNTINPFTMRLKMHNPLNDVARFQREILNNEFPEKPKRFTTIMELREAVDKLNEEVDELWGADKLSDHADALIDLIYFAYGILYQRGVDIPRVWDEVHRANMSKKRGVTHRGHENDAYKPDGWKAPDRS